MIALELAAICARGTLVHQLRCWLLVAVLCILGMPHIGKMPRQVSVAKKLQCIVPSMDIFSMNLSISVDSNHLPHSVATFDAAESDDYRRLSSR